MTGKERLREPTASPPSPEQVRQRAIEGWRLVSVEWERSTGGPLSDAGELKLEIPFGLRIAADCRHLEEHPGEKEAMTLMLEMIVEDRSLSEVARGINQREFQTRDGRAWTQTDVFYLLPRLIEAAPHIFSSQEWQQRREAVTTRMAELLR
jgi:hypothetical protein